ncbi:hypothetical protein K432DRAFT_391441 [Lepidopterella palustris CBS 459.81]|uniref:Uncharacterized protein n=1 Tax=Lepidopterella palustris CBS 459.81 TaxID=1314670 RepID=A0A8E2JH34_9PEZI|nr:hypothetical protein K432DRAFT_391441 [Lepidopterella palustris CBS 459.81]
MFFDALEPLKYKKQAEKPVFGLRGSTSWFLTILAIVAVIEAIGNGIGAAVAVKNAKPVCANKASQPSSALPMPLTSSPASSSPPSTSTSLSSAQIPTPTNDCASSLSQAYTSLFATEGSGSVPSGAGLVFTTYCNSGISNDINHIAEAFVYTFANYIEVLRRI